MCVFNLMIRGSNINSNIIMSFHRLEETRRIHKLVGDISIFIIFRIVDITSNLMFDADALIFLILALLRKHCLSHIVRQVIDCHIEVHDGV